MNDTKTTLTTVVINTLMDATTKLICKELDIETKQNRHKQQKTKIEGLACGQIKILGKELSQFTKTRKHLLEMSIDKNIYTPKITKNQKTAEINRLGNRTYKLRPKEYDTAMKETNFMRKNQKGTQKNSLIT